MKTKIESLDLLANGLRSYDVAKIFGLKVKTICGIKRNEAVIRKSIISKSNVQLLLSCHLRNVIIENMEKMLVSWIEEERSEKNIYKQKHNQTESIAQF